MRENAALFFAIPIVALRISTVRRLWRFPFRYGEGWFLTQPVTPGFTRGSARPC